MSDNKTANNGASPKIEDVREIKITLTKDQEVLIVNDATTALLGKTFIMQDNFENESKYQRAFVLDAVRAHAKAECSRLIAAWDSAIAKTSKLHPTKNREECIVILLESRKAKELKAMVDVAASLKRELT